MGCGWRWWLAGCLHGEDHITFKRWQHVRCNAPRCCQGTELITISTFFLPLKPPFGQPSTRRTTKFINKKTVVECQCTRLTRFCVNYSLSPREIRGNRLGHKGKHTSSSRWWIILSSGPYFDHVQEKNETRSRKAPKSSRSPKYHKIQSVTFNWFVRTRRRRYLSAFLQPTMSLRQLASSFLWHLKTSSEAFHFHI